MTLSVGLGTLDCMSTMPDYTPTKSAPGEWECGDYIALYDEHMRAYHVYDRHSPDRRVTIVRRLTDFGRFVANIDRLAEAS